MTVTKSKKELILQDLKDKLAKAKMTVFSKFAGISAQNMVSMRKELRNIGADYKIAKKTLIKLALKENGYGEPDESMLQGPISVLLSYGEELEPVKKLHQFCKNHEGLKFLGGYLEKKLLDNKAVTELALIPSKNELLGKFVSLLSAPLHTFSTGINSPLSAFTRAMKAYSEKMPSSSL